MTSPEDPTDGDDDVRSATPRSGGLFQRNDVYAKDLAAGRYRDLVKQIGDELGEKHGWRTKAAKMLGVHRSYISRILAGDLSIIGAATIEKAMELLALQSRFFVDPSLFAPDYRDFLNAGSPMLKAEAAVKSARQIYLSTAELEQTFARFGDPTPAQVQQMDRIAHAVLDLPAPYIARELLAAADAYSKGKLFSMLAIALSHDAAIESASRIDAPHPAGPWVELLRRMRRSKDGGIPF